MGATIVVFHLLVRSFEPKLSSETDIRMTPKSFLYHKHWVVECGTRATIFGGMAGVGWVFVGVGWGHPICSIIETELNYIVVYCCCTAWEAGGESQQKSNRQRSSILELVNCTLDRFPFKSQKGVDFRFRFHCFGTLRLFLWSS